MLLMYLLIQKYKANYNFVENAICLKQLSRSAVEIMFEIIYFVDWK